MAENQIVYHVTQQGVHVAQRRRARERRRSQRLSIAIPVFARALDSQGREFLEFTTTLNISAGVLFWHCVVICRLRARSALKFPLLHCPILQAAPNCCALFRLRLSASQPPSLLTFVRSVLIIP